MTANFDRIRAFLHGTASLDSKSSPEDILAVRNFIRDQIRLKPDMLRFYKTHIDATPAIRELIFGSKDSPKTSSISISTSNLASTSVDDDNKPTLTPDRLYSQNLDIGEDVGRGRVTLASSSSLDRSQASGPVVSSSNQQHHQRLCYNCGQPGHISNICPLKHHRKHHGNGAGSGTIRFESIRCFECGEMGHYRTECPKMQERGDYGGYHRLMETDAQFATEQRQEAPVVGGLVAASYHVGSPAETTETVQANWNPTRPFYLETIQEADDVPSSSIAAQEPRLTASPREVGVESRILALEADQVAKAASIIELGKSLGVHVQITMDNETVQWTLGIKGTKAALLEFERSLGSMLGNESKGDAPGGTQDWFKPWDLDATKQHRPAEQTLNLRKNMAKSPSSDDTEHLRQLPKDVAVQKICHRWNTGKDCSDNCRFLHACMFKSQEKGTMCLSPEHRLVDHLAQKRKPPESIGYCFSFNRGACDRDICSFLHICCRCKGDHTAKDCPVSDKDVRPCPDFNSRALTEPRRDQVGGCSKTVEQCEKVHICAYCLRTNHSLMNCGQFEGETEAQLEKLRAKGTLFGGEKRSLSTRVKDSPPPPSMSVVQPSSCKRFNIGRCTDAKCFRSHVCDYPIIERLDEVTVLALTEENLPLNTGARQSLNPKLKCEYRMRLCSQDHPAIEHGGLLGFCRTFNECSECDIENCPMLHLCQICKDPNHPATKCQFRIVQTGADTRSLLHLTESPFGTKAPGFKEVCRSFNSHRGCSYSDWHCHHVHACSNCFSPGHGADYCSMATVLDKIGRNLTPSKVKSPPNLESRAEERWPRAEPRPQESWPFEQTNAAVEKKQVESSSGEEGEVTGRVAEEEDAVSITNWPCLEPTSATLPETWPTPASALSSPGHDKVPVKGNEERVETVSEQGPSPEKKEQDASELLELLTGTRTEEVSLEDNGTTAEIPDGSTDMIQVAGSLGRIDESPEVVQSGEPAEEVSYMPLVDVTAEDVAPVVKPFESESTKSVIGSENGIPSRSLATIETSKGDETEPVVEVMDPIFEAAARGEVEMKDEN